MSYYDGHPLLRAMERIDGRAQALQEAAIDFRGVARHLVQECDELRTMLKWYANASMADLTEDGGRRAQEALGPFEVTS